MSKKKTRKDCFRRWETESTIDVLGSEMLGGEYKSTRSIPSKYDTSAHETPKPDSGEVPT